ncbi:MAG: efflux RND transporter permease subunit [Acidobacteria bacterium]|nr:efflux RND transporter permease subunit [Acidobacteriota bacterium]
MFLTRLALEKTRITLVALVLLLISGVLAYIHMPRSQDPGFTVRTAIVTTYFPGASPERVEKLVSDPLEKAIQEMPELKHVRSTSKNGISIIYVDVQQAYKNMRPIWDSLRRKIDREKPHMPDGVIGPYVNDEFGDVFGILVSIAGDGFSYSEIKTVADQTRDVLLRLENVAKVEQVGVQDERIFLEFNNSRLAEFGLTPFQLRQILASQNIVTPGGNILLDDERISLEPTGNFESIADIENTLIALPGQTSVLALKDLVSITSGYLDPPRSKMYASGYPSLGLALSLRSGGNIIALGEEVESALNQLRSRYPIGIEFDLVAFEPVHVARTIRSFSSNLVQAVLVVILTMVLFLGLRTGFVVAALIPSTILVTFVVMNGIDLGLDKVSLAALIIALGMLVDNAIVMAESIMVHMGAGKSGPEAALTSSRELSVSLLNSSLTTSAAFLPIYLAKSDTGEFTAALFLVVTIALLCSWVLSLTLIPLLCVTYLQIPKVPNADPYQTPFYKRYRSALAAVLRRPFRSLVFAFLLFVLAIWGQRFVPKAFFPPSDIPMFTASLRLASGTAIEKTDETIRQFDSFIAEQLVAHDQSGGVTNWSSYVGEGAPRFYLSFAPEPPTPEYALMLFNVTDYRLIPELSERIEAFGNQSFPDAKIECKPLPNGPLVNNPIEVRLSGNSDALFRIADEIRQHLGEMPGTTQIDDDWGLRTKKIIVRVDQARAKRASLSSQDIAVSLQTVLSGLETTQFRQDDQTIPIILRSVVADREDLKKLEQLSVYSMSTGNSVPLRQIADLEVVWEPPKIKRRDRARTITIASGMLPGVNAFAVEQQLVPWLEQQSKTWPIGFRFEMGGEQESSTESQASIMEQLPIAGMILVLLLVGQFNSIRRPAIILATLPLALIGVTIGLIITQADLGFMAFLGVISLFGIVVNNAIILIDRIDMEINEMGRSPADALIEAGQRRLRPILLTTITTLAGLVPLWTGGGPMFAPMAITIIFGLMFATFLTLGVVPLLYAIIFRVKPQ